MRCYPRANLSNFYLHSNDLGDLVNTEILFGMPGVGPRNGATTLTGEDHVDGP